MITPVGTPAPVQGAMGQYSRATAQFFSDKSLNSQTIGFNPGLFTTAVEPPNQAIAYTLAYPATPGTYPMNFVAPSIWRNGRAEIEVLDAQTFRIHLRFFFTAPIGYVSGATPPGSAFTGAPPYGSTSSIAMFVKSGGDISTAFVPVTLRDFEAGNVTVDYTDGIAVSARVNGPVTDANYMGFYSEGNLASVNYARASIGAGDVDGLPSSVFVGAFPILTEQGNFGTSFRIDPAALVDGQTYYAYLVYKTDVWHSVRSPAIRRGAGKPVIAGDVSYSITDGTTTYTAGALLDVPPCKAFTVKVTMDRASYDAALVAAGITGTQADYFTGVRGTIQSSLTGGQGGQNIPVQVSALVNGIEATAQYTPQSGNTYVVFGFSYTFPQGVDLVLVPVQISIVPFGQLIAPLELCAENESPITVATPSPLGMSLVTQYDRPGQSVAATGVTIGAGGITIDPTSIPIGVARCYEICSQAAVPTEQDCSCDCECIGFYLYVDLDTAEGDFSYTAGVNFPLAASDIDAFIIDASGGASQSQGSVNQVEGSGFVGQSGGFSSIYVQGSIMLANGCTYEIPLQTMQLNFSSSPSFRAPNIQICIATCDCEAVPPPDPTCENFIAITPVCADGELTFLHEQSFGSLVATDVTTCSVNGGAFGACAASYTAGETVTARRRVTFSDGCAPIEASITSVCEVVNDCLNTAVLTVTKTDVLLTLALVGTYASPVGAETIYYSLNGGLAYLEYTAPVALVGTENIRVYSVTTFTDGCPEVVTPIQSAGGLTVDNTEPLVSYCDGAGEITGYAALVGTFPDIETIYFNTDMVQILTVPEGEPCETYAPCATCP